MNEISRRSVIATLAGISVSSLYLVEQARAETDLEKAQREAAIAKANAEKAKADADKMAQEERQRQIDHDRIEKNKGTDPTRDRR